MITLLAGTSRPEVPFAWRTATAVVAVLLLLTALSGDAPFLFSPYLFTIAGGALTVGMARGGVHDRWAAAAGVGLAVVLAILISSPFGFILGLGVGVPAALVASRPQPVATPLVAVGLGAVLLTFRLLREDIGPTPADVGARDFILAASIGVLSLGLLGHAALARSEPSMPMSRRAKLAFAVAGAVLLAISWFAGGYWLFFPIWPFAVALLVIPVISQWRAFPVGALVVAAVALVGVLPAGTCIVDPFSDAPGTFARPTTVLLAQAGGNGPWWSEADGFSGLRGKCPLPVLAAGATWDVALVAAATWAAVGRMPTWLARRVTRA